MISLTTPRIVAKIIPRGDSSNQESPRELLDPTSEHSMAIWYQQRRPVEGITVLSQGMREFM